IPGPSCLWSVLQLALATYRYLTWVSMSTAKKGRLRASQSSNPNHFLDATGLDLLHLGNNRISVIQDRAFGDLTNLRRLYLNGNRIEKLNSELFYGLQSLQYLFLQYNVIREIETGTFDPVPNLQLLFLNNNLLRSLPVGIFSGLTLYRLNLRSNHFSYLPVSGVLDQLKSLLQIDLHENPWDCTCDVVGMKLWLEQLNTGVLVDQVICESPKKFAENYMRNIKPELLCPDYSDIIVSTPTPSMQGSARTTSFSILGQFNTFVLSSLYAVCCFAKGSIGVCKTKRVSFSQMSQKKKRS
uniref:SLIT and NTRK like family member 5 n=1 Tax=Naja naja TaxID=35670 RepID=A0A8C6VKM7_NAJNA